MANKQTDNIVVEAVGLTKVFKDFWNRPKARAVNGIDFTIKQGQVFGLLGPNGSGKSTTVKMILGLLYPTRGVLKVFGEEPRNVDMKSRIGYLPEETYLYRYLTAMETLDFFGALFGLSEEMRRERGEQLLNMVGLAHAFNRPVGEFSKGMARRIGLAQALVNDPDLVILDEPTSGLDPIGCREVKDVIRLLASRGKTIILCSHLLADVQDVCDDVLVLYGGKVRASGPLKSILSEEDKTRMVCPSLSDNTVAELKQWLAAKGVKSDAELKIDHPIRNLEDFFLEVVRQAREQSVDTAGAQAGGEIPDYLADKGTAVLNALRRSEMAQKAMTDQEPVKPAEPAIDMSKLEKLGGSAPAPTAAETAADEARDAAAEKEAQAEKANEKLANLLGKK
ncbi:ABC transporter ATP-binding protein [Oligosphaera ethanolica]|jgi:ABC-2 type transport system ATP-binding protein|uniref:ABC-2 type transport system ATP-binding protein n=1 Tax=Oligosphaera ethanolica TaxID=760260 RepID=A0AAE3VDT8_9BACT|nr:ABC transporter ATP-binding protein [Oligosphaera ethanolica]MDQ0288556.1 ABC-2 type transport system ATP-binding protein [Oligosphaera ethanolica]NLE54335.1 ABC transporter ATP-binding protein [Lentisphaerota bacterium]